MADIRPEEMWGALINSVKNWNHHLWVIARRQRGFKASIRFHKSAKSLWKMSLSDRMQTYWNDGKKDRKFKARWWKWYDESDKKYYWKTKKNSENSDGKIEQMTFQCVLLMPSHSDMKDSWTLAGPLNWSRSGAHYLLGTNCFRAENYFFFFFLCFNKECTRQWKRHLSPFFLMEKYLTLIGALTYCATVKLPPVHPERTDSRY